MDWNNVVVGSERPPRGLAGIALLCVAAVLMVFAWFVHFVAVPWLAWGAVVPAIVFGVGRAHWVKWLITRGDPTKDDTGALGLVVKLMCIAVAAIFTWALLVRDIGGGITLLTGNFTKPPPVIMTIRQVHQRHSLAIQRELCGFQLRGEGVSQFGRGHLCLSDLYLKTHPNMSIEGARVKVQLMGRKGPFGFLLTGFEPLEIWGRDRHGNWSKFDFTNLQQKRKKGVRDSF